MEKLANSETQRRWLIDGRTLSGRAIVLPQTDAQNYARVVLSQLQHDLCLMGAGRLTAMPDGSLDLASDERRWDALKRLVEATSLLEVQRLNAAHYGDNTPGATSSDGKRLLPNPVFTFWDLLQFGLSKPGGTSSFRKACGFAATTPAREIVSAAGLLECDWAVQELDERHESFSTYLVGQAFQCLDLLRQLQDGDMQPDSVNDLRALLSDHGRSGGVQSGLARQIKRDESVRQAGELREKFRSKKGSLQIEAIAGAMKVSTRSVYDYLREYDSQK